MNLRELDSFKMADAITFHDELNPKLWHNNHLRPEVKDQLLLIAEDFLSELGIHDVEVDDITVSGSNAAYSYTPHSDLDLHLLVDMSKFDDNELYKEFFYAKKSLYNEAHHITIHGVPVEVYVQDAREPVVSLGEYSVLHDKWLRIPTKRRANFDQTATKAKYQTLKDLIEIALKSKDLRKVNKITNKIKQYRQAGLDKGGEFGPENLAYKALRSQGYITKLYDLRDKLHSEILTIENMYQNPEQVIENELDYGVEKTAPVTPYGMKEKQFRGSIAEGFDQPYPLTWEKSEYGDVDALAKLPDGTPLSIMFNNEGDGTVQVEFYRNNSQEVTGEGDAMRVFATVLTAIQQYVKEHEPEKLKFSASKDNWAKQQQNSESRSSLYDKLVQRYSKSWGYGASRSDKGDFVLYQLTRMKNVAEASGYIPSEKEKHDPRFKTALTVDIKPDSIKKNAKSFYWKTSRAGVPPTARPDGKF
jgi:hypothetical protein